MKKIITVLSLLLICIVQTAYASTEYPELEKPVYIQDHLNIFNEDEKLELNKKAETLRQGTTSEILMMTMPTIGQTNRQDYALGAGRHYGVGDTKKENGIVILLNLDNNNEFRNRGIAVSVGYGLEGVLNDAKVGQLIEEYAIDDMKQAIAIDPEGKDPKAKAHIKLAMTHLYDAVVNEINEAYGFDGETYQNQEPVSSDEGGFSVFEIIITIFLLYLIITIFFNNGGRGGGGRRGGSGPIIFFPTGGGFSSGGFSSGGSSFGDSFGDSFGAGGGFGGGGADRGF